MAMKVSLQREEGPEGGVQYSVRLGDEDEETPPVFVPRDPGKVVKIHSHVRIFSVSEISTMRSSFECRFDLYLSVS